MRVSLNWLKDYVDFTADADALAHQLTMLGLEIEWIERPGAEISNVVVGRILSIEPHPNADKLVVCRTDVGRGEALQIVCGAKNMKEGDVVPTAILGAALPGGFTIERRKMRGIESQGMMCSKRELGLGDDHQGLYILSPDLPIGADVKPLLGLDDTVFEVSITPNRGDWACMIGIAREIAAKNSVPLRIPDFHIPESDRPAEDYAAVDIEAPDLCPRYIGRVLHGVKIGPSPEWLQQRLIAAGQRPISNIVDITNYVMLETGQPLHAFDHDKLNERRIVVRTARPGETLETIDGQPRRLTEEMLVIADAHEP
ncbi:MAG TPA: phenylalanine--tRNA ligase subunit beta, partial [Candidatus Hydrogenedentes bacterium]|nr:phenylalanine--tRNA ligase subunit beta [Candidatus Hydrogenedentota bacterium]